MALCISEKYLQHVAFWHLYVTKTKQANDCDYETNRIVCDNDYSKCCVYLRHNAKAGAK